MSFKIRQIIPLSLLLMTSVLNTAHAQNFSEFPVADFTELCVDDGVKVIYHVTSEGDAPRVFVNGGTDETMSMVTVQSGKEKLIVRLTDDGLKCSNLPTLTVTSSKLIKVQNNGDSLVVVENNCAVPKFSARLEGNGLLQVNHIEAEEVSVSKFTGKGTVTVSGQCEKASLSNTGTGCVDCAALKAADAKCNIVGTGHIYCNVSGILSVTGVSGTIFFTGMPSDIKNRALGVKLRPIEQLKAQ